MILKSTDLVGEKPIEQTTRNFKNTRCTPTNHFHGGSNFQQKNLGYSRSLNGIPFYLNDSKGMSNSSEPTTNSTLTHALTATVAVKLSRNIARLI